MDCILHMPEERVNFFWQKIGKNSNNRSTLRDQNILLVCNYLVAIMRIFWEGQRKRLSV